MGDRRARPDRHPPRPLKCRARRPTGGAPSGTWRPGPDGGPLHRRARVQGSDRIARGSAPRQPSAGCSSSTTRWWTCSRPTPRSATGPRAGGWPAHEVGRNADFFDPAAGKLLKAGSTIAFDNVHLHSNGAHTLAHLDVGLKFHPRGYTPTLETRSMAFGNGVDLDIEPMDPDQQMEAYFTLPEKREDQHLRAAHARARRADVPGRHRRHHGPDAQLLGVRSQLGARVQLRGRRHPAAAERHDPAPHRLLQQLALEPERVRSPKLVGRRQPLRGPDVHQPHAGRLPDRRAVRGRDGQAARRAGPGAGRDRHRLSPVRQRRRADGDGPRGSSSETGSHRHRRAGCRRVRVGQRGAALPRQRAGGRAGVRRLGAERRRVVQPGLRDHEPQLGRGAAHPDRSGQQYRAGRTGPGAADLLPAAAQPVPVPGSGPGRLRRQRGGVDGHEPRMARPTARTAR